MTNTELIASIRKNLIPGSDKEPVNGYSSVKINGRDFYNFQIKIVFWTDGTKTVVKCQEGDEFDHEKGVALCFMKKALGNQSNFNNTLNKWLPAFLKEEEK